MDESVSFAHLVGSVPLPDSEAVFREVSGALDPHLRRLPDGETGERIRWIWFQREMLLNHPDMEIDPGRRTVRGLPVGWSAAQGNALCSLQALGEA